MRAVWLAMRDEDPPDRGLAELLAAARHKAEAMQPRPSAWQRLMSALRRPPVLAFATVTVLIAGAVLIGRRVPRATAPGLTATPEAEPTRPAASDPGAGSSGDALGAGRAPAGTQSTEHAAAGPGGSPAVAVPQPAAPPPPPTRTALLPDHSVQPASPTRIATAPASMSPATDTPGEAPRDHDDDRAAAGPASVAPPPPANSTSAPAPSPPERVTAFGSSATVPRTDTAGGDNAPSPARPRRAELQSQPPAGASNDGRNDPANRAGNNTGNAANPVANGVGPPAPRPAPAPAPPRSDAGGDLYQQCEVAAHRGDCATVRRLVGRITRTDRGYLARVAKDSSVGKCLAE
jgi:hypothetical protein